MRSTTAHTDVHAATRMAIHTAILATSHSAVFAAVRYTCLYKCPITRLRVSEIKKSPASGVGDQGLAHCAIFNARQT